MMSEAMRLQCLTYMTLLIMALPRLWVPGSEMRVRGVLCMTVSVMQAGSAPGCFGRKRSATAGRANI
jgi:hypothetical protein